MRLPTNGHATGHTTTLAPAPLPVPGLEATLIYVDDHLLVLEKPAGLPAVPGKPLELKEAASTQMQRRYPDARVVHRLDMATSGVMVMARGLAAQQRLNWAFAQRQVSKTYRAIVAGHVSSDGGSIALPLCLDWPNRPRQHVNWQRGKPALTHWTLERRGASSSALEVQPITGRSHQLRVHLAAIGHPILGDPLYASEATASAAKRLMLHAQTLVFEHPASGTRHRFESPLPAAFDAFLGPRSV